MIEAAFPTPSPQGSMPTFLGRQGEARPHPVTVSIRLARGAPAGPGREGGTIRGRCARHAPTRGEGGFSSAGPCC